MRAPPDVARGRYCPECDVSVLAERVRQYVTTRPRGAGPDDAATENAELRGFFREISRAVDQVPWVFIARDFTG